MATLNFIFEQPCSWMTIIQISLHNKNTAVILDFDSPDLYYDATNISSKKFLNYKKFKHDDSNISVIYYKIYLHKFF